MKKGTSVKGLLIVAGVALVAVAIASRVKAIGNVVFGTAPAAKT